jgi:hypothetical protein
MNNIQHDKAHIRTDTWGSEYGQGRIVFDEPLPNVNTASPYILRCESHPPLVAYTLNCWHTP